MKKVFVLATTIVLFVACNQKQRYTQNSPEIDSFNSDIESYNDQERKSMTDGKGIQEDAFYDNLLVFYQLGVVPPT